MSNFRKSDVMAGHAKSIAVMLAIASAILLLSGCAALGQPPAVSAKPLVFAIDAWPPAWYFDVASEKGYLARENASVEIIRFNGSYSELLEFFTDVKITTYGFAPVENGYENPLVAVCRNLPPEKGTQ